MLTKKTIKRTIELGDKRFTEEECQAKLNEPCEELYMAFGQPWCTEQKICFLMDKRLPCPKGRKLK